VIALGVGEFREWLLIRPKERAAVGIAAMVNRTTMVNVDFQVSFGFNYALSYSLFVSKPGLTGQEI
jgi:hypothetical protein